MVLDRTISGQFNPAFGNRIRVASARQDRLRISAIGKLGLHLLAGEHLLVDL